MRPRRPVRAAMRCGRTSEGSAPRGRRDRWRRRRSRPRGMPLPPVAIAGRGRDRTAGHNREKAVVPSDGASRVRLGEDADHREAVCLQDCGRPSHLLGRSAQNHYRRPRCHDRTIGPQADLRSTPPAALGGAGPTGDTRRPAATPPLGTMAADPSPARRASLANEARARRPVNARPSGSGKRARWRDRGAINKRGGHVASEVHTCTHVEAGKRVLERRIVSRLRTTARRSNPGWGAHTAGSGPVLVRSAISGVVACSIVLVDRWPDVDRVTELAGRAGRLPRPVA